MADSRVWPARYRYWHVYALPNLRRDPDLARLVHDCHQVLAGYSTISPVAPTWLHCTVQRIGGRPAAERSEAEREALVAALTDAVLSLPAITLTAGPPMVCEHSIMLDLTPDSVFNQVHHVVRSAVRSVCGAGAFDHDSRPPHVTLGYAMARQDGDVVQSRLRHIRPGRATMTVSSLHLVEVIQDPVQPAYRWTTLASFRMEAAGAGKVRRAR